MDIKVLIVDDDELMRDSLKIILDLNNNINVIDTCSNGDEAYKRVLDIPDIDVILMDIRMPVCDGVLATKKIMQINKQIKIIILTTFDDDEYIFEALKNGAKGYLLKSVTPDKIIDAIKVVHSGNLLIHPAVAIKVSGMLKKEDHSFLKNYGFKETDIIIIKHIADGFTNREIAEKVYLSEGTIKNKISYILETLNLRDRTQIAIFYLKNGKM